MDLSWMQMRKHVPRNVRTYRVNTANVTCCCAMNAALCKVCSQQCADSVCLHNITTGQFVGQLSGNIIECIHYYGITAKAKVIVNLYSGIFWKVYFGLFLNCSPVEWALFCVLFHSRHDLLHWCEMCFLKAKRWRRWSWWRIPADVKPEWLSRSRRWLPSSSSPPSISFLLSQMEDFLFETFSEIKVHYIYLLAM